MPLSEKKLNQTVA